MIEEKAKENEEENIEIENQKNKYKPTVSSNKNSRKKTSTSGNSNKCPECGFEMKTTRKMFEKHGKKLPTCVCGTKMALDLEDYEESEE